MYSSGHQRQVYPKAKASLGIYPPHTHIHLHESLTMPSEEPSNEFTSSHIFVKRVNNNQ